MTTDLDKLTAERVMGWKWCDKLLCWYPPNVGATLNDTRSRSWSPSTNIAAAWEVVEHLRSMGFLLRLMDQHHRTGLWDCRFYKFPEAIEIEYLTAKSATVAICTAALAVKGVSEDEVRAACKEQA